MFRKFLIIFMGCILICLSSCTKPHYLFSEVAEKDASWMRIRKNDDVEGPKKCSVVILLSNGIKFEKITDPLVVDPLWHSMEKVDNIGRYIGYLGTYFLEINYKDGSVAFLECWPDRNKGLIQGFGWRSPLLFDYFVQEGVVRKKLLVPQPKKR